MFDHLRFRYAVLIACCGVLYLEDRPLVQVKMPESHCVQDCVGSPSPRERVEREPVSQPRETAEQRAAREYADAKAREDEEVRRMVSAMEAAGRNRDYEQAKRLARSLLDANPSADLIPRIRHYLVLMTFARAYDAYNAGDWSAAEREFKNALPEMPNDADAHDALGRALERQDKLDEAATEYETALWFSRAQPTRALEIAARLRAARGEQNAAAAQARQMSEAAARMQALKELQRAAGTGQSAVGAKGITQARCAGSLVWDSWSDDACQSVVTAPLLAVAAPAPAAGSTLPAVSDRLRVRLGDLDEQLAQAKQRMFSAQTPEATATADREMKDLTEQKAKVLVEVVRERWTGVPVRAPAQN